MLHSLGLAERSVGELASPFRMSFSAASKHVKTLEKAGRVRRRIAGRTHMCQLEPKRVAEAYECLSFYERFWSLRLDDLERELRNPRKQRRGASDERVWRRHRCKNHLDECLLPGPIERVWDYLTDSTKRGKWFAFGKPSRRLITARPRHCR